MMMMMFLSHKIYYSQMHMAVQTNIKYIKKYKNKKCFSTYWQKSAQRQKESSNSTINLLHYYNTNA